MNTNASIGRIFIPNKAISDDYTVLKVDKFLLITADHKDLTVFLPRISDLSLGNIYTLILKMNVLSGSVLLKPLDSTFENSEEYRITKETGGGKTSPYFILIGTIDNGQSIVSGSNSFLELLDVPSDYSNQANKLLSVTSDETGLQFSSIYAGSPISFINVFDSSEDQTRYELDFSYTVNGSELLVFSGGIYMIGGVDYTEFDITSISFFDPRDDNENVVVLKLETIGAVLGDLDYARGFTDLTDAPSDYTGHSLQFVRVNVGESALEFANVPMTDNFTDLLDVPADYTGHSLQSIRVNVGESGLEFYNVTDNDITAFIELDDVPADYTGHSLQFIRVNVGESGLEFTDVPMTDSFIDLTDVPNDYSGYGGYTVKVNASGTGLEFIDVTGGGTGDSTVTSFLELTDTPDSYGGHGGGFIMVTSDETGIEFVDISTYEVNSPISAISTTDSTDDQTIFPLSLSYEVGSNQILVFSGGMIQAIGSDYTERDSTSIQFLSGRVENEKVVVIKLKSTSVRIGIGSINQFQDVDITSNYSCVDSFLRLQLDSTAGSFDITFPDSPLVGDEIECYNACDSLESYPVTLKGNGKMIQGSTSDFILDLNSTAIFVYNSRYG